MSKVDVLHTYPSVSRPTPWGVCVRVCPWGTRDTKIYKNSNKVPKIRLFVEKN